MTSLIEYLLQHHDKLLYVLAGLSLVIELGLMGLSGPLLFFAIGCALTGVLVSTGTLNSWEFEILSVGLISLLSAIILWKPLKKFQGSHVVKDSSSDMIGQIVPVAEEITLTSGTIRYSGINWQARLDNNAQVKSIASGSRTIITAVDGTIMLVKELNNH